MNPKPAVDLDGGLRCLGDVPHIVDMIRNDMPICQ